MNCPNCGQPIDPGASFCGNCGQSVFATPPNPQPVTTVAPAQTVVSQPAATVPPPSIAPGQSPAAPPLPAVNPIYPSPTPLNTGVQAPPYAANPVGGTMQPAYALPGQSIQGHKGETKAIVGLVAAVLGIPGALIPIVGIVLGVTGLVIGTTSRHIKKGVSTASIIVGIVAILLSIAAWTFNVTHDPRFKGSKLSSVSQDIDTPCYSAKISTSLHVDKTPDSCKLSAMDGATLELSTAVYSINSVNDSTLNASNFDAMAQKAAPTIVKAASTADRTYTLSSEKSIKFAGKQAHIITAESNQNTQVELVMVLNDAPNGDNVFVISAAGLGKTTNVSELEKSFIWK